MKTVSLKPIVAMDGETEVKNDDGELFTVKTVLLHYLGVNEEGGDKVVMRWAIGRKLYDATDTLELEDAEYEELCRIVRDAEKPLYRDMAMGQVMACLEEGK